MRRKHRIPTRWFSCDFETNVTRETVELKPVWAWGACLVGSSTMRNSGTDIGSFFEWLDTLNGYVGVYFHNLNFDGMFIISWLLENGAVCLENNLNGDMGVGEFSVLRTDGKLYSISFRLPHTEVLVWDSLKKIPLSVANMSRAFGLRQLKGEIDYELFRDEGHELTEEERAYLENDVVIVSKSLEGLHDMGVRQDSMTMGADAYTDWECRFRSEHGDDAFNEYFETFADDEWLLAQDSYKGGITLVNPEYQNVHIREGGLVYDVNSMYPAVMQQDLLPYGHGRKFNDNPPVDADMWIATFTAHFAVKDGMQAVYRPKHYGKIWPMGTFMRFSKDAGGFPLTVTLTSVDFEIYSKHYDIWVLKWHGGYAYDGCVGIFESYISHWGSVKEQAAADGNKALKTVAKLKLNSLYGKFGQATSDDVTLCSLDDDGVVEWNVRSGNKVGRDDGTACGFVPKSARYMPMATFITSHARRRLCDCMRKAGNRFVYCDTDSVHVLGTEPLDIDVHPTRFGAWDLESEFTQGKWIRAKAYAEMVDGEWQWKLAGCPKKALEGVTLDDFRIGAEFHPKLVPVQVPHGVILEDRGFTFKER